MQCRTGNQKAELKRWVLRGDMKVGKSEQSREGRGWGEPWRRCLVWRWILLSEPLYSEFPTEMIAPSFQSKSLPRSPLLLSFSFCKEKNLLVDYLFSKISSYAHLHHGDAKGPSPWQTGESAATHKRGSWLVRTPHGAQPASAPSRRWKGSGAEHVLPLWHQVRWKKLLCGSVLLPLIRCNISSPTVPELGTSHHFVPFLSGSAQVSGRVRLLMHCTCFRLMFLRSTGRLFIRRLILLLDATALPSTDYSMIVVVGKRGLNTPWNYFLCCIFLFFFFQFWEYLLPWHKVIFTATFLGR